MTKYKYKNVKHVLVLLFINCISILLYIISLIYANKSHASFTSQDPNLLIRYDSISGNFLNLYVISIIIITLFYFFIKMKNKKINFMYLTINLLLNFTCLFIIDFIFNKIFFTFVSELIQFSILLLSSYCIYLILTIAKFFKDKKYTLIK